MARLSLVVLVFLAAVVGRCDSVDAKPPVPLCVPEVFRSAPEMQKRCSVDFKEEKLLTAVTTLAQQQGLDFRLDKIALYDEGVYGSDRITVKVQQRPLHVVLERMLQPLGLTWLEEDGVFVVTTFTHADSQLEYRTYEVGDIVDAHGRQVSPQVLSHVLQSMSRGLWEDVDGTGGKMAVVDRTLHVRQTAAGHREIRQRLTAIRKCTAIRPTACQPAAHQKLFKSLQRKVKVELPRQSLRERVERLSKAFRVPIRISAELIEQGGLEDIAQELPPRRRTLQVALHQSLTDDLTFHLVDEEILIQFDGDILIQKCVEANDEPPFPMVYSVGNLVHTLAQQSQLTAAIRNFTEFDIHSGQDLYELAPGFMVINQSLQNHLAIQVFLQSHRQSRPAPQPLELKGPAPIPGTSYVTWTYRCETGVAEDLRRALPRLVSPGSWQQADQPPNTGGEIVRLKGTGVEKYDPGFQPKKSSFAVPRDKAEEKRKRRESQPKAALQMPVLLFIRQTPTIHREIEHFLTEHGIPAEPVHRPFTGLVGM